MQIGLRPVQRCKSRYKHQVTGDGQLGIGHSGIGVPAFGHRLRQPGTGYFLRLFLCLPQRVESCPYPLHFLSTGQLVNSSTNVVSIWPTGQPVNESTNAASPRPTGPLINRSTYLSIFRSRVSGYRSPLSLFALCAKYRVLGAGVEPAYLTAPEPKSGVSAIPPPEQTCAVQICGADAISKRFAEGA